MRLLASHVLLNTRQCKGHKTCVRAFEFFGQSQSAVAGAGGFMTRLSLPASMYFSIVRLEKFHVERRVFIVMINSRAFFVRIIAFLC